MLNISSTVHVGSTFSIPVLSLTSTQCGTEGFNSVRVHHPDPCIEGFAEVTPRGTVLTYVVSLRSITAPECLDSSFRFGPGSLGFIFLFIKTIIRMSTD